MSVDLGKPFQLGLNDISDQRFNAKMWTTDTDTNLFNMVKIPGQFMLPTSTGNGFTKNQPCFCDVDNVANIIAIGNKKHAHSKDTDLEGGLLVDSFKANAGNLYVWHGNTFIDTDFLKETGSGGTVTTSTGATGKVLLTTGTSTNSYANIRKLGLGCDLSKSSILMAKMTLVGTIANYLLRVGINGEMINDANDPNNSSFGIEACSGQTNWQTWSCAGAGTRSTTATSYAVDTGNHTWMAQHTPATPNIVFTRSNDTANAVTKTSDIPTSGNSDSSRTFSAGVKSTTSSQSKDWEFRGAVIYANVGFSDWKWYAV